MNIVFDLALILDLSLLGKHNICDIAASIVIFLPFWAPGMHFHCHKTHTLTLLLTLSCLLDEGVEPVHKKGTPFLPVTNSTLSTISTVTDQELIISSSSLTLH